MSNQASPKVAVIGCGYWGKNLVRNFHQIGALDLVCDPTPTGREEAAKIAPEIKISESLDEVWSSTIDGVVIATPAETHYNITREALKAGKHVFVEKPLALTYDHGAALVKLAEKQKRILMVGHVLEYHPGISTLHRLVQDGELGRISYIYSNRLSLGKVRREENILWSFAPHDIAIILRMIGSMPFQVSACGGSYVTPNIADVTVTNLLFDNGVNAHIHVSWLHPFKEQRLVIVGSKRMASFDDVQKKLMLYDQHVSVTNGQPVPFKGPDQVIEWPNDEPLRLECQAFLNAMVSGQPPLTDGISGLRVLKVLQAAQRSLITRGEPVTLPMEFISEFSV